MEVLQVQVRWNCLDVKINEDQKQEWLLSGSFTHGNTGVQVFFFFSSLPKSVVCKSKAPKATQESSQKVKACMRDESILVLA